MQALCDLPESELTALCAQRISRPVPPARMMDAQWKAALAQRIKPCAEALQTVRRTILDRFGGGEEVLISMGREEDVKSLLERGQLWVPQASDIEYLEGEPSSCHDNCGHFWMDDPERFVLATGYGLSEDGLWRPHSWLIDAGKDADPTIVETTVGRLAYFGYALTLGESIDFVFGEAIPKAMREQAITALSRKTGPKPR